MYESRLKKKGLAYADFPLYLKIILITFIGNKLWLTNIVNVPLRPIKALPLFLLK